MKEEWKTWWCPLMSGYTCTGPDHCPLFTPKNDIIYGCGLKVGVMLLSDILGQLARIAKALEK